MRYPGEFFFVQMLLDTADVYSHKLQAIKGVTPSFLLVSRSRLFHRRSPVGSATFLHRLSFVLFHVTSMFLRRGHVTIGARVV